MKRMLFLLFFFLTIHHVSQGQVYLGGTRVISQFSPASLEEYRGYGALIQRQLYIKESKFSLTPTFQLSLLNDKQYAEFNPEFYTSISLGTHLNYDVFSFKKFGISPFIGPSFIWVSGLQSGGLVLEPNAVDFYRLGLEGGVALTFDFTDKFSVKFLPLTYTWGANEFVQGNVVGVLFQIK